MEGEDLFELSQTSQYLGIDEEIDSLELDLVDITEDPNFQYPALVLTDVKFNDAVRILQTRHRKSYRSVDVWLDMEDGSSPTNIGTLPLELETLLMMRYLGINVTAYLSPEKIEHIDLSDPFVLEQYM